MRRQVTSIFVVLFASALAGCADATKPQAADPVDSGTPVPAWSLGDHWSFEDSTGQTFTLVVAADDGSDWRLLTDNQEVAFFDHLHDISYVGPISKHMLSGRQGADEVRYFDFPLHDGKTWHTSWDGEHRLIKARETGPGRFELVGHASTDEQSPVHVHYTFDAAKRFLDLMTFHNATTGEPSYTLRLASHGSGYRGEVYVYEDVTELASASTSGGFTDTTFQVPDTGGELAVQADIDCAGGTGTILLAVDAPGDDGSTDPILPLPVVNEPTYGHAVDCPAGGSFSDLAILEATPGPWRLSQLVAGSGGFVATTVSHRIVTAIPVG